MCSHKTIKLQLERLPDGSTRRWWQCRGCGQQFTPKPLAATTPGEPRALKEHTHEGTPHMGRAFAAHDGFPAHQHLGLTDIVAAATTPGEPHDA